MTDLSSELCLPGAYPYPVEDVELVETHISWVFLAGPLVYKVKKPVNLGFVDYTTLDRRKAFCAAEVELNQRLAPDVYLGVVPVARWGGAARFEAAGEIVDYAVKMKRLRRERMLDALVAANHVTVPDVERLACVIAGFHASSRTGAGVDEFGSRQVIEHNWRENFDQVRPFEGRWLSHAQLSQIYAFVRHELERLGPVFERRMREGRVRDCHGDLRSESVWMSETGEFQVFDCIEFNDRLRYADVASEVAFLASDLDWRGRPDLAWSWVEAYVAASGDEPLRDLLPFYKCYRVFVRGKVEAMQQHEVMSIEERAHHGAAAREHFHLAEQYTLHFPPALVLVCGQIASGKTTLARGLGSVLGLPVISSDRVRKQLAGLNPFEHQPTAWLYSADSTRRTYDELYRRAGEFLRRGQAVVLDATFNQEDERQRAMQLARRIGAGFLVLALQTPDRVIYQRLAARAGGELTESDADRTVFEQVRTRFEASDGLPSNCLARLPAGGAIQATVQAAIAAMRQRLATSHGMGRIA